MKITFDLGYLEGTTNSFITKKVGNKLYSLFRWEKDITTDDRCSSIDVEELKSKRVKCISLNPRTLWMEIELADERLIVFEKITHNGEVVGWLVESYFSGAMEYLTQNGKRWEKRIGDKIPESAVIIPFALKEDIEAILKGKEAVTKAE